MDGLTEKDEQTIRAFLRFCLNDGFYAFVIDGKNFLLESEEDIDEITAAIRVATPPVIKYRVGQATQVLERVASRQRELQPA